MEDKVKNLKEKLFRNAKNAYSKLTEEEINAAFSYCEGYKEFLAASKTEREAVKVSIDLAKSRGFKEFVPGEKYCEGDRLFINNRGKAAAFILIGKETAEKGVNIVAAHLDSPRLDL